MTSVAPRDEKLVSGISGGSLGCVRVNLLAQYSTLLLARHSTFGKVKA
jgi:hypothetical protein